MLERRSPLSIAINRWVVALAPVIVAVPAGRPLPAYPHLLPNMLPDPIVYELGPALIMAVAINAAIIITRVSGSIGVAARLALFSLAALAKGAIMLAVEFDDEHQ